MVLRRISINARCLYHLHVIAIADLFTAFKCIKLLELFACTHQALAYRHLRNVKYLRNLASRKAADHREEQASAQSFGQACHSALYCISFGYTGGGIFTTGTSNSVSCWLYRGGLLV